MRRILMNVLNFFIVCSLAYAMGLKTLFIWMKMNTGSGIIPMKMVAISQIIILLFLLILFLKNKPIYWSAILLLGGVTIFTLMSISIRYSIKPLLLESKIPVLVTTFICAVLHHFWLKKYEKQPFWKKTIKQRS